MKIREIIRLNESSMIVDKLKKFAKTHYSDAEDENEALLTLFARSLQHAEEDDNRQDTEIDKLKNDVNILSNQIKKANRSGPTPQPMR
jgi:polyhydroxyalkanoate synthesis regulator phasin